MHENWSQQMPLIAHIKDHSQCQELDEMIRKIIDANTTNCDHIAQDLNNGEVLAKRAGV